MGQPLWPPWALMGQALVAPLGTLWAGPDGHPTQSKVRFYGEPAEPLATLKWHKAIYIYIYICMHIYICIYIYIIYTYIYI